MAQLLAHTHKNLSQHVLATAIAAVAPVPIVRCMFHQLRISCRKQYLPDFRMLAELRQHRRAHHPIFDGLPIRPQRSLSAAPHTRRDHRRLHVSDRFTVNLVEELLGLEIVLAGRPDLALQANGVGRKVGEAPVLIVDTVELDNLQRFDPFDSVPGTQAWRSGLVPRQVVLETIERAIHTTTRPDQSRRAKCCYELKQAAIQLNQIVAAIRSVFQMVHEVLRHIVLNLLAARRRSEGNRSYCVDIARKADTVLEQQAETTIPDHGVIAARTLIQPLLLTFPFHDSAHG